MSMNVNNNGTYGVNVPLTGTAYANVQKADELVKANSEAAGVMAGRESRSDSGNNKVYAGDGKSSETDDTAVIYEKSDSSDATYSTYQKGKVNKMSAEDRARVAEQLKSAAEQRQKSLMDMVNKTLSGQAAAVKKSKGLYDVFANMKVDAATAAQAQKDISEDGYWGVKQTSQRLFDFASALAGDDVNKMREMQNAMQKGFKQATKAWGRELPSISQLTMDRANQLFEDYYSSKEKEE